MAIGRKQGSIQSVLSVSLCLIVRRFLGDGMKAV